MTIITIIQADIMHTPFATGSAHMALTSPPYWGLRSYATGDQKAAELGSEPLHDCGGWVTGNDCGVCFICHLRQYSREIWRVLRDDGVYFLNLGDSYANAGSYTPHSGLKAAAERADGNPRQHNRGDDGAYAFEASKKIPPGLKPKDLCGIPWRAALALQADGWYLRSDIIWAKPNPMPESVTDRPTKAHEYIFLLTKRERYFWDAEAVRESGVSSEYDRTKRQPGRLDGIRSMVEGRGIEKSGETFGVGSESRNIRTVWNMATHSYPGAHFATWPPKLAERMIKAGTSERGCCPECGRQWERVTESKSINPWAERVAAGAKSGSAERGYNENHGKGLSHDLGTHVSTLGFRPSCTCPAADPIPCTVYDPFSGAGTTALVARKLGRNFIGTELSAEYIKQSMDRLGMTELEAWGEGDAIEAAGNYDGLPLFGGVA